MRVSDAIYLIVQFPIAISSAAFMVAWLSRSLPATGDGTDFFAWGLATYGACAASLVVGLARGWRPSKLLETTAGKLSAPPLVVEALFVLFGTWTLYRIVSEGGL